MNRISLTINGEPLEAEVEPRTSLADFLRARGLTGTHVGCEHGVCGACTIMIEGIPARSCITYAVQMHGRRVDTIEGFDADKIMSALRSEFTKQHALQCGFCTPGMLITARDIVLRLGNPGEARIREELAGNLCRCTGYAGIVRAIENAGIEIGRAVELPAPPAPIDDPPSLLIEERDLTAAEAAPTASETPAGAVTVIEQTLIIDASCDRVWTFFHDVLQVAACLPGANLSSHDSNSWEGTVRIKMGPIRAQMDGKGKYELMEDRKAGRLEGAGADAFSGSRLKGFLDFYVAPDGPESTRLTLSLSYALQGALAQFARSSLAKEFVRLTVEEFAQNVSDRLAGRKTTSQIVSSDFTVFSILRKLIASWWRGHP